MPIRDYEKIIRENLKSLADIKDKKLREQREAPFVRDIAREVFFALDSEIRKVEDLFSDFKRRVENKKAGEKKSEVLFEELQGKIAQLNNVKEQVYQELKKLQSQDHVTVGTRTGGSSLTKRGAD